MGIGRVNEKDTAWMGIQVREDKKHLLETATGKSDIQRFSDTRLLVNKVNTATYRLLRIAQSDCEQSLHKLCNFPPVVCGILVYDETQVAQYLGSLALTQQHIDSSRLENGFLRFET